MDKPVVENLPDGIDATDLAKAINKVRISEGITPQQLAGDAKLSVDIIHRLNKDYRTPIGLLSLTQSLADSTKLGIKSPQDVIAIANSFPDITRENVNEAIKTFAERQRISMEKLERRKKEFHPAVYDASGKSLRTTDFISEYYKAKVLGFASIGAMLVAAQELAPRVDDNIFASAVDTWTSEMGLSKKSLLGVADVLSRNIRPVITGKLGFNSEQELVDAVNALEPLPDRESYGRSVRILRMEQGMSLPELAKKVRCSKSTLAAIENNLIKTDRNGYQTIPESSWLRKIPEHLGCDNMADVIEQAKGKFEPPKRPNPNTSKKGHRAIIEEREKGAVTNQRWVDLTGQSRRVGESRLQ